MKNLKFKFLISHCKKYFITGLIIWIPIWVTILILKFIINFLDNTITLLPEHFHLSFNVPGLGLIFSLLVVLLTGIFATNFIGKSVVSWWDSMVGYIPLVRTLHHGMKDVLTTFVRPKGKSFTKVFLIEFPQPGIWSIAFQTVDAHTMIKASLDKTELINLFIPMTPNITSGFLVILPKKQATELDMSIEQALKYIISLGVVGPELKANLTKNKSKSHT